MTGVLLVAGLAVWAAGAAVDLTVGASRTWARLVPYAAGAAGSVLVTVAGVRTVFAAPRTLDLGTTLGMGHTLVHLDPLTGLFLTLTAGLGTCVSACMVSWARPAGRVDGHGTAAGYLLLLGSVTVVVVAGDAFTFLFGWESLTVSFVVLTGVSRRWRRAADASWVTGVIGKAGGAALLVGFMLLAGHSHSLELSAWSTVAPGAVHDAAYLLVVIGFGAKVGMVPFEVWLPGGYAAAPGPTRAAMAGLAANVGFYGLWRFLAVLGPPPQWLVVIVLVLGGVTALLGIAFAAVQSHLDRVVAFSSVENAGVILVGYGVALAGAATRHPELAAVGLLAASLQVLAHAVAKSGLFASAAFFESDHGTDDLQALRGVGRQHPSSAAAFGVGALTLAGLPPTIGFVSEWMVLEALMQEFRVHQLALRLAMAGAGALVALTVGMAALTFARLIGLMLRGRSSALPEHVRVVDGGGAGRAGLGILAVACLALAAVAPWVVRFVADGLAPVVPAATMHGALRSPWVLQPVFPNFSVLSPSWLVIVMPIGVVVVLAVTVALSGGTLLRVRRVPAWRSATDAVSGPSSYSPFGYANVLRHVLGNVLGTRRQATGGADGQSAEGIPADGAPAGGDANRAAGARSAGTSGHAGDDAAAEGPGGRAPVPVRRLAVSTTVVEPVVTYLYRPARAATLWVVMHIRRVQSGRLDAYVGYMLVALVVLLAIVAALG
ncbi:MAG: proton-conducting transporter membrane subunit [Actinomycetota bacterium]|nr:proton-conducting transporter membrane subunit [Actinomycetota bacterium]